MPNKRLRPGDPEVVDRVIQRIREMTREEWLERFRKRPDFDEAWVLPVGEAQSNGAMPVESGKKCTRTHTITRKWPASRRTQRV